MPTRTALVRGKPWDDKSNLWNAVSAYLPGSYEVVQAGLDEGGDFVKIRGEDFAGWTLDDYVIPRLATGGYFAQEVV